MYWKEVTLEEAMDSPSHVPATIHYYEDKKVWLCPMDQVIMDELTLFFNWIMQNDFENYNGGWHDPFDFPDKTYTTLGLYKQYLKSNRP